MRRASVEMWRQYLVDRHLTAEVASIWSRFARPNVRLVPTSPLRDDVSPLGASRLGGLPDLPVGMAWPMRPADSDPEREREHFNLSSPWEPQPLSFLAQINLSDVAREGCDLPLPCDGLLLFFYDAEHQPWGFDPHDSVGTQVLYVPKGTEMARNANQLRSSGPSPEHLLRCEGNECLPTWECILERTDGRAGFSADAFRHESGKLNDADWQLMHHGGHALGGWPSVIQNPMELQCELVTNGIYVGGPEGYEDPRAAALQQSAQEWRLLLQLDSDDGLNWMWGDAGRLYFWCRESDMTARRFDRCWTILQCY